MPGMFTFLKSTIAGNRQYFDEYIASLSAQYDDYLEEYIEASQFYAIYRNEQHTGYFAIFEEHLLTQFYVCHDEIRYSQDAFRQILADMTIDSAYVPTCDELFLSLCMDFHSSIQVQAYNFTESNRAMRAPEYPRSMLRLATKEDMPVILERSGIFMTRHEEFIEHQDLFLLCDGAEMIGLGALVCDRIMQGCAGPAMFTCDQHLRRGVGRSIIMHLTNICRERGLKPIAGCRASNFRSKLTLESAGYVSKTRLLKISFGKNGEKSE